jgi:hypothetical protein
MAMSLNMCPLDQREAPHRERPLTNRIRLDVPEKAWKAVRALGPERLAHRMGIWDDDDGLEWTLVDAYDEPLTWLRAGLLVRAADAFPKDDWWAAAAFAMLRALPEDVPVVLYWC